MADKNIIIENADIRYPNFSGREKKYNREGDRNFCIYLDEKRGKELEDDGWNIRWVDPINEESPRLAKLQIAVSVDKYPAKIILVTKKGQTVLDKETIDILDNAEFENVDLVVRPYNWEVNGRSGVKAYLQRGYFTISDDDLFMKYNPIGDDIDDDVPF